MGGDRDERGQYLAVDGDGGVVVAGVFGTWVMDFDPSCQVLERAVHCPLGADTFVVKLTCFDPSADFNGNGAVDLAHYQTCFTGPQQENPVSCPTGCATFDFNPDDAINLLDLPAIQAALQGP